MIAWSRQNELVCCLSFRVQACRCRHHRLPHEDSAHVQMIMFFPLDFSLCINGLDVPRSGSHMRNPPDTSRLSPLLRTCPPPTSIFRQNFKLENYNSENKSPPVSCLHDTCDHNPQRVQPKATSFYAAQAVAFSNFKKLLTSVSVSSGLTQKWNF